MKRLYRYLVILTTLIIASNNITAQTASYTTNSGIKIGFGMGSSYQTSDIANSAGFGFDFTFGSSLYQKENAFLAVDWKFRFLAGENKAYDHRINTDLTYSNIRYSFFDYDFELGLTLNRLRERTRIVLTGFAGAGITHGRTFTDLLDENNTAYNFSSINNSLSKEEIKADLMSLSDNDFETRLSNKAAILPTAGIYLGYQFTRSLTIGIEHKINFSLSEDNSAFGINIDNKIMSGIDMNHYTLLGFRWTIRGRSGRSSYNASNPAPVRAPIVHKNPVPVVAIVGEKPGRTYYADTTNKELSTTRQLTTGRTTTRPVTTTPVRTTVPVTTTRTTTTNPVVVNTTTSNRTTSNTTSSNTTTNRRSTNTRTTSTTRPVNARRNTTSTTGRTDRTTTTATNAPTVRFINPPAPTTVDKNLFSIRVQTTNVRTWEDVSLVLNGINNSNFSFSSEGIVTLNIALKEGQNSIVVSGKNPAGSARDNTTITYNPKVIVETPCYAPVVNFSLAEASRSDATHVLNGTVSNVGSKEMISISFNGTRLSSFQFNPSSGIVSALLKLNPGTNSIKIDATNECGTDSKTSSLTIQETPCYSPAVNFNLTEVDRSDATHDLRGTVTNVGSKEMIAITLNGTRISNFQFQASSGTITAKLKLNPGTQTIKVDATNECGKDSKTSTLTIQEPCSPPSVNFSVNKIESSSSTHKLAATLRNVENKSNIRLSINGSSSNSFTYDIRSGSMIANLKLVPGRNTIVVAVSNDCGDDSQTLAVNVEEEVKPCGVRINPGNSDWQFCLVTPRGTYNRDNLSNTNFSYSGSASSLFFKPIAGGGDAIVNGKPYKLKSGSYYLFTGSITVTVSTKNPGSMGQWSICITTNKAPVTGNGNNRPQSPCEKD